MRIFLAPMSWLIQVRSLGALLFKRAVLDKFLNIRCTLKMRFLEPEADFKIYRRKTEFII